MTTLNEAIEVARKERLAGNIKSYTVTGGNIYAVSPHGGEYVFYAEAWHGPDGEVPYSAGSNL